MTESKTPTVQKKTARFFWRQYLGSLIRFFLRMLIRFIYPIETLHRERIPAQGPVLLVANHLSYLDAFLVQMATHRPIRFIMDRQIYNLPVAKWIFQLMGVIPIYSRRHADQYEASFAEIRKRLEEGEVICIFPEGQVSRTGQLFKFKAGMERILQETPCPVVPICISGIWGSLLTYSGNRFFRKRPVFFQYPVTVAVGFPLPPTTSSEDARQAVQNLGMEVMMVRKAKQKPLHQQVLRQARRHPFRICISDENVSQLSYSRLCREAKMLAWQIQKFDESRIGLALPTSTESAVLNLAMAMAGKTVVNLNFDFSVEQISAIVHECGIRTIIACEALISQNQKKIPLRWITPQSIRQSIHSSAKLLATLSFFTLPARLQHFHQQDMEQTLAIVYTAGTRAAPKGVRWTHHNLASNIEGFMELVLSDSSETMVSSLPFHFAYGLNVACWLPMLTGIAASYPEDPHNVKSYAEMLLKTKASILAESPDLLTDFARNVSAKSLGALKTVISGGSALSIETISHFKEKWDVEVLEGYGAAECSPLISVNIPSAPIRDYQPQGSLSGSLGRPIPGVAVKVLERHNQQPCSIGTAGILWVGGASVTPGYAGSPGNASELLQDGWFCTEDEGYMNEDGFLFLVKK
ncbi:MAG: AMP-binding protein [SAR324 cluster bacterium]|nr:AMP-binding protein [SAR324 cluster bacterium]